MYKHAIGIKIKSNKYKTKMNTKSLKITAHYAMIAYCGDELDIDIGTAEMEDYVEAFTVYLNENNQPISDDALAIIDILCYSNDWNKDLFVSRLA